MMGCTQNGAYVNDEPAGPGFPATYWACDLYQCAGCGTTIAVGFSQSGHVEGERIGSLGVSPWIFEAPTESHSFRYPGGGKKK
jgi:hypothetical protein